MYPSQEAREIAVLLRISRELDVCGDVTATVDNPSELIAWASALSHPAIVAWHSSDSRCRFVQVSADHHRAPVRGRVAAVLACERHPDFWDALDLADLATGQAVGGGLRNADNLAIDAEGNIYIIEDRGGGSDDDIWFAVDKNKDGDLLDAGEGLARWASNGTVGSEFTGLYFDFRQPNIAYVNIQHPSSGVDRLIEIKAAPNFQKGSKP